MRCLKLSQTPRPPPSDSLIIPGHDAIRDVSRIGDVMSSRGCGWGGVGGLGVRAGGWMYAGTSGVEVVGDASKMPRL